MENKPAVVEEEEICTQDGCTARGLVTCCDCVGSWLCKDHARSNGMESMCMDCSASRICDCCHEVVSWANHPVCSVKDCVVLAVGTCHWCPKIYFCGNHMLYVENHHMPLSACRKHHYQSVGSEEMWCDAIRTVGLRGGTVDRNKPAELRDRYGKVVLIVDNRKDKVQPLENPDAVPVLVNQLYRYR